MSHRYRRRAVDPNGATITDGARKTANLSLTGLTQAGPQIDTVIPNAPVISGDVVPTNAETLARDGRGEQHSDGVQRGDAAWHGDGERAAVRGALPRVARQTAITASPPADTDAAGNVSTAYPP